MSEREHKEYLKEFKGFMKEVTKTKESSLDFLQKTGISTPTGKLKKVYSSPKVSTSVNA